MSTEPAVAESEENNPEGDRNAEAFRSHGLPRMALVDSQGDLWVVSSEWLQVARITRVLALRLKKAHELCAGWEDMPPANVA